MLVLFAIPLLVLALLFRTFFLEPFSTPAGSMAPTLIVGDYFFVAKAAYGYSRYSLPLAPPLFSGRIFGRAAQRGDVAVFRLPTEPSISYVKRIVGLPGDRLQIRQGRLYINDQLVPRRPIEDYAYHEGNTVVRLHQYIETPPNDPTGSGIEYRILETKDDGPLDNTPVYLVPPAHYFVLGDNRDNSQDSRVRSAVGYIPEENLVGRAEFIFYSSDGTATRSDRMLKAVN